ncbi:MAG: FtsH protease activity modulator HflK [Candidatus Eisenbacteria bacterium]|nr:FtsH protease activity modulator HflK [Candidatus Eisenbacteria bacterium]
MTEWTERPPGGGPEDERGTVRADMRAGLPKVGRLARWLVLAAVVMYVLSGIYVVEPDERGVVKRFGRVIADDIVPGIHYRIPWPVDTVETPQTTSIKRMSVGYKIVDQIRGLRPEPREAQFLTGDTNIIEVQLLIQYVLKDPSSFLYDVEEPHWLIRKVGESVLTKELATHGVDEVLTVAKVEIAQSVKAQSQAVLDDYGAGVEIVAVHIQEITPPREVADAFRDVASAREDRNRITQEASGYANRVVPMARGEAQELITAAEGYRTEKSKSAEGEAARFTSMLQEYRKAQGATRERLYLEIMEEVLATARKHIIDADAGEAKLDLRFLSERE